MEYVRTSEERFNALEDFPYEPNYLEWSGLHVAHIDEGPSDAPVALLLHGEPTWSYLYHKMLPPLLAAGYRCIAPDHVGFGRSDKPIDDDWYVIERHVERIRHLIESLDLGNITLFCQDWGGPIGLRQAVDMPDRFSRLVIMNTWLHHEAYEYTEGTRFWREAATHRAWLRWTQGNFPCGAIVASSLRRRGNEDQVSAAYELPYDQEGLSKAGARRFPWCIPMAEPEAGGAQEQERCFHALKQWHKPVNFIFGADDRVFTPEWGRHWSSLIKGSTFDEIPNAGHFVQEDAGEEVVAKFLERLSEHS